MEYLIFAESRHSRDCYIQHQNSLQVYVESRMSIIIISESMPILSVKEFSNQSFHVEARAASLRGFRCENNKQQFSPVFMSISL